jgi:non-lysosomal glucosylceramidase
LDFDGGAPPEQAWRRKLNSHANLLKEFSVTFMEAMRMVRMTNRFSSLFSVFPTTSQVVD